MQPEARTTTGGNLRNEGTGTPCELKQHHMKTNPASRWSMRRGCLQGWTLYLTNLECYFEHEIDLRSNDVKRPIARTSEAVRRQLERKWPDARRPFCQNHLLVVLQYRIITE